jgi:hypothetical protein
MEGNMIIETNEGYNPQMERIIASRSFPIGSKVKMDKYVKAFQVIDIQEGHLLCQWLTDNGLEVDEWNRPCQHWKNPVNIKSEKHFVYGGI